MKRPQDATCAPSQRISQRAGNRRSDADASCQARAPRGAVHVCVRLVLLASALLISSCNLDNPGTPAPRGIISYPVSVAISREAKPRFLYVANSNFDLAFSGGSVQSINLVELERRIDDEQTDCRHIEKRLMFDGGTVSFPNGTVVDAAVDAGAVAAGDITLPADYGSTAAYGNPRGVLCDGRDEPGFEKCCFNLKAEEADPEKAPSERLLRDELPIDSFATGVAVAPRGDRLYVPVSSRTRLLYIDVTDGDLSCDEDGESAGRCRRGASTVDPEDPSVKFPGQPSSTALAVGQVRDLGIEHENLAPETPFVVTAHELGGVALFVDDGARAIDKRSPMLESVVTGLPERPTSVVVDPSARTLYVTHAGQPTFISRLGVHVDRRPPSTRDGEAAPRDLLYQASNVQVSGLANARDIRDGAVDPRNPSRLFALVRGLQESIAFLELDAGVLGGARLVDAVRVGAGPSKLDYIELDGRGFLVVTCYDARAAYILDADRRSVVGIVRNLAGPFEMAFDAGRKWLYVADFRASVVRVVDLSGLTDKREPPPRIIATLGAPRYQGGLE